MTTSPVTPTYAFVDVDQVRPVAPEAVATIYLCGPMTGLPEFNYPSFRAAATAWRHAGVAVLSPVEHTGIDTTGMSGNDFTDPRLASFDVAEAFTAYAGERKLLRWLVKRGAELTAV